jgi:hypothetical protein
VAPAKKSAAKKAPAKKAADKPNVEAEPPEVTQAAGPDMEGEEYQQGYLGVSGDDEDYSIAAEAVRLADGE